MLNEFSRTEMLLGSDAMRVLADSRVAVFGLGGVGSFAAEALARSGIGHLVLVDHDDICITNINRQLHATHRTIGQAKADVIHQRIMDINPSAEVEAYKSFYPGENPELLVRSDYDYIVDAIDTVTSKLELIVQARSLAIPIISCMGTGNKLDPSRLEIADIYSTSVCPLAKVMRRELRKRGVDALQVVYSQEEPLVPRAGSDEDECLENPLPSVNSRHIPGSISFVPPVAGMLMAGVVIRYLVRRET
ncbi:MAG: ThiF family adenylyltransferase [Deltaproteobacteria bacterium]